MRLTISIIFIGMLFFHSIDTKAEEVLFHETSEQGALKTWDLEKRCLGVIRVEGLLFILKGEALNQTTPELDVIKIRIYNTETGVITSIIERGRPYGEQGFDWFNCQILQDSYAHEGYSLKQIIHEHTINSLNELGEGKHASRAFLDSMERTKFFSEESIFGGELVVNIEDFSLNEIAGHLWLEEEETDMSIQSRLNLYKSQLNERLKQEREDAAAAKNARMNWEKRGDFPKKVGDFVCTYANNYYGKIVSIKGDVIGVAVEGGFPYSTGGKFFSGKVDMEDFERFSEELTINVDEVAHCKL